MCQCFQMETAPLPRGREDREREDRELSPQSQAAQAGMEKGKGPQDIQSTSVDPRLRTIHSNLFRILITGTGHMGFYIQELSSLYMHLGQFGFLLQAGNALLQQREAGLSRLDPFPHQSFMNLSTTWIAVCSPFETHNPLWICISLEKIYINQQQSYNNPLIF